MALKRTTPDLSNSKSLVTGQQKNWVDLDLAFVAKPGSLVDGVMKGDVYKKKDTAAVMQSVRSIILTNFYEKPFNPTFGSNVRSMLFENKENYSESMLRERIKNSLSRYEPRAIVEKISFFDDDGYRIRKGAQTVMDWVVNDISIQVQFRVETNGELFTTSVNMSRLR